MTTDELALNADLAAIIMEKHQLAGQYAPEIFLGVSLIGYGARVWWTLQKLEQIAALKEQEKGGKAKGTEAKAP